MHFIGPCISFWEGSEHSVVGNKGPFTVVWNATHCTGDIRKRSGQKGKVWWTSISSYPAVTKLGFANISVAVQPRVNLAGTDSRGIFPLILVLLESGWAHILYCRYYCMCLVWPRFLQVATFSYASCRLGWCNMDFRTMPSIAPAKAAVPHTHSLALLWQSYSANVLGSCRALPSPGRSSTAPAMPGYRQLP